MIASTVAKDMQGGSMIRKMFEEGNRLRAIYGADKVFDFSLGNPDNTPPETTKALLKGLLDDPDIHKYMPNAGYPDVREKVAAYEGARNGVDMKAAHVVMTVGAAGAMNCTLKALLNPGDQVLVLTPCFVEYVYYIRNWGAEPVFVPVKEDFMPDADAIAAAVTKKTRAIIINSPNNPTGAVYTRQALEALRRALDAGTQREGLADPIVVLSDEPYIKIAYEAQPVPVMSIFDHCVIVNSFSKSLALPGERIGYAAISPRCKEAETLAAAITFNNRTLGFVNAPSLFQKAAAQSLEEPVDTTRYKNRRDRLYQILTEAGFACNLPQGAFYLFPKCPIADDRAFCEEAAKLNLLLVPGSGFFGPGHVRLAYCVSEATIENSAPAFMELGRRFR